MLEPVELIPEHVYDDGAVRTLLGVTESSLLRARANRELKFTRKGRRVFYLGTWLLDWLKSPEAEGLPCINPRPTSDQAGGGQ